ncbi:MAG: 2-hydroxyacid dehydrogenase [Candidatus Obscuribacterales bacterium]|nr:2-hydroxyacid dehydrogenase [Candidatus Obscuribacterales bacterium]
MKILLCNKSYPKAEKALMALAPGNEIISCDPENAAAHLDGVDIIIPSVARVDADLIKRGQFGLIQQLGVGLDNVDIAAASAAGVFVANVPGAGSGNTESVAELAILHMLALSRNLFQAQKNFFDSVFFKPAGVALLNKQVCIIGLGDIGKALALRLRPFAVKMTALREHPEHGAPEECGIEKVYGLKDLHTALAAADFVVLAIPETDSTRNLIDKAALAAMKKGSYLINVGRGGVVEREALYQALNSGHLAGAGLDVFWEEPANPEHPLYKENLVLTPHLGGNTDESLKGVVRIIAENIKLFNEGKRPRHLQNELLVESPRRPV